MNNVIEEDKNVFSKCGCKFENDYSNTVILCEECSKLPCHNDNAESLKAQLKLADTPVSREEVLKNWDGTFNLRDSEPPREGKR